MSKLNLVELLDSHITRGCDYTHLEGVLGSRILSHLLLDLVILSSEHSKLFLDDTFHLHVLKSLVIFIVFGLVFFLFF